MKTLINNIVAFLTTDLVNVVPKKAKSINKGLPEDIQQIPFNNYPYVSVGDNGERAADSGSATAINRFYSVIIVMGVFATDKEKALDAILDLSANVETSINTEANRQKDGHVWGISIEPFDWNDEKGFYMGRVVTIDYMELEEKYFDY